MKIVYRRKNYPFELFEINLDKATSTELIQISNDMGLALNLSEMRAIRRYFRKKKRNPYDIELQTIGQTWSEHCFHKTFKGRIINRKGKVLVNNIFKSYIAKVTRELNYSWCLSVFEDNAGIIDFTNGYGIAAKVETHNHPSAIEPFGGAATGVGGVIRDPMGVWAYPIACTDVLCFGPLDYDFNKLPDGVKHPKYLFNGVVTGIGFYGNNMGIPTVNGGIYFDEGYVGNIIVYCGCIGILPMSKFIRDTKPGDIAILVGGRTGRDGIHGVTFASSELTEDSGEISRPAVQIPNPIEEEKIKRTLVRIRDEKLGSSITDLGGGGLSCAAGEMANRAGCGVYIELDKVPLKNLGMAPWEIWISESQERMFLSVREKNLDKVLNIFQNEDVEATPVGFFTDDRILKASYKDVPIVNLDLNFLFKELKVTRVASWNTPHFSEPSFKETRNLTEDLLSLLSSSNIASRESVIRTYDHEVQGNTVLKPLHGKYSSPNDATIIKPLPNSWRGIVISCGMNPNYGKIDPYWMAASSIDEAIRNNVCVGGRRISLLDNFTWGNPEKPDRLGGLIRAASACYKYAKLFKTPFISGKDSLYNESTLGPVTPTLLITAIGIIPDIRKTVSSNLKRNGNPVYMVGETYQELGGSEYYKLKGFIGRSLPKVRNKASRNMEFIVSCIDAEYIASCHDCSEGGLAVAAAEMAIGGDYGLKLFLRNTPTVSLHRNDHIMFSESNSRFLVEVHEEKKEEFESSARKVTCSQIGEVVKESNFVVFGLDGEKIVDISLNKLRKAWRQPQVV